MAQQEQYRHELKYQIDYGSYLALRSRLKAVMRPDAHTRPDGRYVIRSIYFDTLEDKALREKTDGVQTREKFRIRWYNDDLSFVTLEKKCKHNDLGRKLSAPITEAELKRLLAGDLAWMKTCPSGPVRELYTGMTAQSLRPKVLVSYLREPYVYGPGNVRITFDSQIRTSLFSRDFLNPSDPGASAADSPDHMLMEVKFDAFLPEVISHLIQEEGIRQGAFSKYAACRRFG